MIHATTGFAATILVERAIKVAASTLLGLAYRSMVAVRMRCVMGACLTGVVIGSVKMEM